MHRENTSCTLPASQPSRPTFIHWTYTYRSAPPHLPLCIPILQTLAKGRRMKGSGEKRGN